MLKTKERHWEHDDPVLVAIRNSIVSLPYRQRRLAAWNYVRDILIDNGYDYPANMIDLFPALPYHTARDLLYGKQFKLGPSRPTIRRMQTSKNVPTFIRQAVNFYSSFLSPVKMRRSRSEVNQAILRGALRFLWENRNRTASELMQVQCILREHPANDGDMIDFDLASAL